MSDEIKQKVFAHRLEFKNIIEKYGDFSLFRYLKKNAKYKPDISIARQRELLSVTKERISTLINKSVAKDAISQLKKNYYVSTADHHGPICHPFFVHSLLAQSVVNKENSFKNTIVFSCSGTSMDNSSYPRGLFFNDSKMKVRKLSFFSLKYRHYPVYSLPSYKKENLEIFKHAIDQSDISSTSKLTLRNISESLFGNKILKFDLYGEQITHMNYVIWKHLPEQSGQNLIYLEQEDIVARLILKYHIANKNSILYQIIFNENAHDAFYKYFDSITGAFSSKENKGTFLFWAFYNGKRIPLHLKDGFLFNKEENFKLALNPETVKKALLDRSLIPSMAFSFITLSFYYGLTCGGGFSQVDYLSLMKKAYQKLLEDIAPKELKVVTKRDPSFLSSDFTIAQWSKDANISPTGLDFILYCTPLVFKKIKNSLRRNSLSDSLSYFMPFFYKIITGKEIDLVKAEGQRYKKYVNLFE